MGLCHGVLDVLPRSRSFEISTPKYGCACIWGSLICKQLHSGAGVLADIIDVEYEYQWPQYCSLRDSRFHRSFLWTLPNYNYPLHQFCQPLSDQLKRAPPDPIVLEFSNKSLVCDSVKGFGKVEHQEIKLITVIQTSCQVLYSVDELGLAAKQCLKAVLEMHQDFVYVHMVHDAFEHNVLEHFAAHTCEWYGSVISCNTSLAFIEDRSEFGILPILRDLSWIEGLLEDPSEDGSYVISKVFQQSRWYQVWAYGLSGIQLLEQCFDPIDRDPDACHWWVWAGAHTGHVVMIFINENTWILIVQDMCLTFAGCL